MKIGIVGLGLIGGSMARTIKLHLKDTLYGIDLDPNTMRLAYEMNAIDGDLTEERVSECDLIFVALYPGAIIRWITEHAGSFKPGALIIDCGGVKKVICDAIDPLAAQAEWNFIGGHPMAGREFSGFAYARDDMFDRASMILAPRPDEDPELVNRAKAFFIDIGFHRVQITTPAEHDDMIAYTSQLAHVVSSAYVKSPLAGNHTGFSAGSFADMTRVARLNENMWTELFFDNREALLPELDSIVERMTEYRDALRDNDHARMKQLLREGREIKERLSNTP